MAAESAGAGLTDMDILVDAARGVEQAARYLAEWQALGEVRVSVISAMELIAGCRDKTQLSQVKQFLARIHVLPITTSISHAAQQLMESFHLSHGLLPPDALIAATALEHGLPLHTRNVRHFHMISSLLVTTPY